MEYDLLIRQQSQLVQLAQGLASASEALATSMSADETAISPSTACEILTNLMKTIMTLRNMTDVLRSRLVACLYRTGIGPAHVDVLTGETRETEASVLAADEDILRSATSLELAERCFSRARTAITTQVHEQVNSNSAATVRSRVCCTIR